MFKSIISWFMPSNASLAKMGAAQIQKSVNSATDGREATVAKYAALANEAATLAQTLSRVMADGKIDDLETNEIAEILEPLCARFSTLIKG